MSICSWEKQYKTAQERQVAMEKLLIDITKIKTSNGLAICIPQVGEIANIYNQAEIDIIQKTLKLKEALKNLLYILEDYEGSNEDMERINKAMMLLNK